MTYDPYEEAGLRRDLPRTEPRVVDREESRTSIWLPIAIAVALLHRPWLLLLRAHRQRSTMRADTGAVTKPAPSPN